MKKLRWLFVGALFVVFLAVIAMMVHLDTNSEKAVSNKEELVTIEVFYPTVSNDKDQLSITSDSVLNTNASVNPSNGLLTINSEDIGPFYPNILYRAWKTIPLLNH